MRSRPRRSKRSISPESFVDFLWSSQWRWQRDDDFLVPRIQGRGGDQSKNHTSNNALGQGDDPKKHSATQKTQTIATDQTVAIQAPREATLHYHTLSYDSVLYLIRLAHARFLSDTTHCPNGEVKVCSSRVGQNIVQVTMEAGRLRLYLRAVRTVDEIRLVS